MSGHSHTASGVSAPEACFYGLSPWGMMRARISNGLLTALEWLTDSDTAQPDSTGQRIVDEALAGDFNESRVLLDGTPFRRMVWQELMRVPRGTTLTYSQLAARLHCPRATRAVASAVAANRIAIIVPCHRIVPVSGAPGRYRWGEERKAVLLAYEQRCNALHPHSHLNPARRDDTE